MLLPGSVFPAGPVQFMFSVILVSTSGSSSMTQVKVRLDLAEIILLFWSIVMVTFGEGTVKNSMESIETTNIMK